MIYLTGFIISALIFGVFMAGAVFISNDPLDLEFNSASLRSILILAGAILTLLALGATAVGGYLYQHNVVLITSDKLAQVLYKNIFDRKISQLSIGDIQDVTVSQKGLFARMFNYGTLVVETAGEQQNYTFTFTPKPYKASKALVNAHEENLKLHGN